MNLLIDIGNSFTHIAVHNGKRITYSQKVPTNEKKQVTSLLKSIAGKFEISSIAVASVSPQAFKAIQQYTLDNFKLKPLSVNNKMQLPLKIKVKNPGTVADVNIAERNLIDTTESPKMKFHILSVK